MEQVCRKYMLKRAQRDVCYWVVYCMQIEDYKKFTINTAVGPKRKILLGSELMILFSFLKKYEKIGLEEYRSVKSLVSIILKYCKNSPV